MKKIFLAAFFFFTLAFVLWSAAQAESSGSATRGKYLAGKGMIIPENEIYVDAYIAQIDYKYPLPADDLGITLYTGHRQISAAGQDEVIQVGIQARELAFSDLPPMNLAFVIDKSGSMDTNEKMNWVKESFAIFIEKVRDIDFVALVVFDSKAEVLFPSTRMDSREKRLKFKSTVDGMAAGGGTNLMAGLDLGYREVFSNFREDYSNRVLFLTDGVGESIGILEKAAAYRELGINVSTIGLGTGIDLKLLNELAKEGGGSSRFISDRTEMEKTFGSELDRMVVPAARDLRMELKLLVPAEILGTWGYDNRIEKNTVSYYLPTLHHRDYETILLHCRFPASSLSGRQKIAAFSVKYKDLNGSEREIQPQALEVSFVKDQNPVAGFSDGMVLRSGTMMHFALALKEIAPLYTAAQADITAVNTLRSRLWEEENSRNKDSGKVIQYDNLSSEEIRQLEKSAADRITLCLNKTLAIKKELVNARLRLDNTGFDDEIGICDNYLKIFGKDLEMDDNRINTAAADMEIQPPAAGRKLVDSLNHFFDEIVLAVSSRSKGALAVSGFTVRGNKKGNGLTDLLNEKSLVAFKKMDNFTLVERTRLEEVLKEQQLALSDLMDTEKAIQVGRFISANLLLTGSVIEMAGSVIVFGRIINIETAEIESAAQLILEKSSEVMKLLN